MSVMTRQRADILVVNQLVRDLLGASGVPWADAVADGSIELAFEPGDIPQVRALPTPLRDVLVALIVNAVEARRHGGELEIPRDEGRGGVVTFHLPPHREAVTRG